VSNLVDLPDGRKLAPELVASRLRFSPYIKDALVVGGGEKPFVSAVVIINYETVTDWAERHRVAYTTFTDLSQKPEVYDLIAGELRRLNRGLPEHMRIRKFVNLHKEFDADEAEMTRTRKLRRAFLEERYQGLIAAIYQGQANYGVEATVTYRDGRVGHISTSVHIRDLGEGL
jgi:long-chain acyl-CoA synthetase